MRQVLEQDDIDWISRVVKGMAPHLPFAIARPSSVRIWCWDTELRESFRYVSGSPDALLLHADYDRMPDAWPMLIAGALYDVHVKRTLGTHKLRWLFRNRRRIRMRRDAVQTAAAEYMESQAVDSYFNNGEL
jgi:hypothetical protein